VAELGPLVLRAVAHSPEQISAYWAPRWMPNCLPHAMVADLSEQISASWAASLMLNCLPHAVVLPPLREV